MKNSQPVQADRLYGEILAILEDARASSAYRAVNVAMVQAYWRIGSLIVEDEQGGAERAEYGKAVLQELSKRLTAEFGKGFDVCNLRNMRQFYLMFSKRNALRSESSSIGEQEQDVALCDGASVKSERGSMK